MRAACAVAPPPPVHPSCPAFPSLTLTCQRPRSCGCLTQRAVLSLPGNPVLLVAAGDMNISCWVEEPEAGCCGHSVWLWLLLEIFENGFRGVEKMARSFIARAHPPVLFMKRVAFNQNLFEFHPCLAHDGGEVSQGLGECYFPGQFVGRMRAGRGWKGRKSEERVRKERMERAETR